MTDYALLHIRLPRELLAKMLARMGDMRIFSQAEFVRRCIEEFLKRHGK